MKVTGKNGLGSILKIILQIGFFAGIIVLASLPFILNLFGLNLNASFIIIYPNGIGLLVIIYKFIKLFDSLKNNNPFCENNVKILKSTAIVSLIEALLWIFDLLYETILAKTFDVVTIVVLLFLFILFFGVAIALYILSELFREATVYKEENELTI